MAQLVPEPCYRPIIQIFFKPHHAVYDPARGDLDYPVRHSGNEFMVVGGKQHHFREGGEPVIQGSDRFQVQVIGRLIHDEGIGAGQHHPGEHAADPLPSGEDTGLLHRLISGKQHLAEEPSGEALSLSGGRKLTQPLYEVQVIVEVGAVFFREIGAGDGDAPAEAAAVRLQFSGQDLEQRGFGETVAADKSDLVPLAYREA